MLLLLDLQVYLHQIINLNTNVLKVFQVFYNSFLVRDYYVCKKSKFLTSQSLMTHFEKRKVKYPTIFYLYLKEVRLIKNTGLEHSNTC